jgi:hypothetical protein
MTYPIRNRPSRKVARVPASKRGEAQDDSRTDEGKGVVTDSKASKDKRAPPTNGTN